MHEANQTTSFRVLGIDPGLTVTGYAVVRTTGSTDMVGGAGGLGQAVQLQEAGIVRPVQDESLESRLEQLFLSIGDVLDEYEPDLVTVEDLHTNVRHPRTAILMGHARGVLCLAAGVRGIPVRSYAPTFVKKVVTGSGRAGKSQVRQALCRQLNLTSLPTPHDLSDAIAVAVCGALTGRRSQGPLAVLRRSKPGMLQASVR